MTDLPDIDRKVYPAADGEASLADMLHYFKKAGRLRVSDLHLKVGQPPTYRVDGDLQKMKGPSLTAEQTGQLVKPLLSDLERERLAADGSVDTSYISENFQFRINVFRDNEGLCAALRALENDVPPLEEVGFPNNAWQEILKLQQGLVLLTGITGAGKSTTIASLVTRIASERRCRIITLEDPIEYRLTSDRAIISQREVGRHVPSFERGLRDALREDPDVIFVGEMRDRESTRWTLTAAETGHLVFSTLHTRDARGSITRLLDMFAEGQQDEVASQLSLGLRWVVSQKLIPRSDGMGRVVAMELLHNTYAVANLIRLRKLEQLYSVLQTRTRDVAGERMMTMEQSLVRLVRQGQVDPLEAEKWAEDPTAFVEAMQRAEEDERRRRHTEQRNDDRRSRR
ncbi:MAG: PilT/PilU family type 4a pilus ATPase [Planctomycetes bacterium]|jgi:twitching motility protein PilT|nr:PilT/PilU family type 4a pilus ATPase [Planctomycetota bacterium]